MSTWRREALRPYRSSVPWLPGARNLFEHWLKLGHVISDARFESGGVDADDDYVILEFRRDPAAAEFT